MRDCGYSILSLGDLLHYNGKSVQVTQRHLSQEYIYKCNQLNIYPIGFAVQTAHILVSIESGFEPRLEHTFT